jgi:ribonuclease HII
MGETVQRRKSPRLQALHSFSSNGNNYDDSPPSSVVPKKRKRSVKAVATTTTTRDALPRTRQDLLQHSQTTCVCMGIDEAGRGPLAGPVVAAAAMVPTTIPGITDSKQLTKEHVREELYQHIVQSPNVRWAVAIVDAPTIDEINILQATLKAMAMAAQSVIVPCPNRVPEACIGIRGCFVVCGQTDGEGTPIVLDALTSLDGDSSPYALIDGNKVPKDMPCPAESIIKGDSKEYLIAAASILAKVTRDRLMHQYHALYPQYDLGRHKGYPTAAHISLVRQHGASPIHRRTFAPLKHMTFDEHGKVMLAMEEEESS